VRRLGLSTGETLARPFGRAELARRAEGRRVVVGAAGAVALDRLDFRLTARPDRIVLLDDGRVHIIDYKTGELPTPEQQEHFAKQLPLEAAMVARGAFPGVGRAATARMTYVRLHEKAEEKAVDSAKFDPESTWVGLGRLIAAYQQHSRGFSSRRAVVNMRHMGDYDHLARYGEWTMSDKPVAEDVGDD